MSTASKRSGASGGRRAAFGFTMFEVVVTVGILVVMVLIMEGTLTSTRKAERRLEAVRTVTGRGERITYELLDEVNASHKLFSAGSLSDGYLAALDLTRLPASATARLPVIDEVSRLAPDVPGQPRTGNMLLLVREAAAAPAFADAATNTVRLIDLYRLVCVYPHETTRLIVVEEASQPARDLVVWRSVRFASHAQILDISDDDHRTSVVADLVERFGVDYAWDPNEPVAAAFFGMDALGTLSATPEAAPFIAEDLDASPGSRLTYANVQLARTTASDFHRRSLMTNDAPTDWVPGGFETKIVGRSGSRQVWMHLVVEAAAGRGIVGVHASTVTASPRDL